MTLNIYLSWHQNILLSTDVFQGIFQRRSWALRGAGVSLIPFKPEGEFKRWICCQAECRQEVKSHQGTTPHFKITSPFSASCSRLSSCLFFLKCYITFSLCGVFPPPYTLYHTSVLVFLYMLRYTWSLHLGFKCFTRFVHDAHFSIPQWPLPS